MERSFWQYETKYISLYQCIWCFHCCLPVVR